MENLPDDYMVKSMAFTKTTHTDEYPGINPESAALSMEGKVIIITGASRGIGARGFSKQFGRAKPRGLVLVSTKNSFAALSDTEALIRQFNKDVPVLKLAVDISQEADVTRLFKEVKEKFGHADVLFNNAALATTWTHPATPVQRTDISKWWKEMEVNLKGPFMLCHAFINALPDPQSSRGTIILVTSAAAWFAQPGTSSYTISKIASVQLAAVMSQEGGLDGANPNVDVIAFHPGTVKTDMTVETFMRFSNDTPELTGGVGVWLATDKARFMNGRVMNPNWDVGELMARKDEVVKGDKLKIILKGEFGEARL